MDNGLVLEGFANELVMPLRQVLILIVVDNSLVLYLIICKQVPIMCLNPYCSGQWSSTAWKQMQTRQEGGVLILIVVDNGLVPVQAALNGKATELS